jgi:ABC-2 type transport system permease protein
LILFCSVFGGNPESSTTVVAGLICINVMSGSLLGTTVIVVAARERGVLRRYKVTPMALWKVVTALIISRLFSITMTTLFLIVLARLIYDILMPVDPVAMIIVFAVGTLTFCAISLAVAGLTRTSVQANGVAQVLFLPMMFLGGAAFPKELLPLWMQKSAYALPSTYYVAGMKNVMVFGGSVTDNIINLIVMGMFLVLAVVITVVFFRWE